MKKLFLIICFSLTILGPAIDALAQGNLDSAAGSITNPFISKLPKPKTVIKNITPPPPPPTRLEVENPQPARTAPAQPPAVTISGVVWNSDRPQAIINGQVVDVGDKISEMEIVSISKSQIDVLYLGEKFTLTP